MNDPINLRELWSAKDHEAEAYYSAIKPEVSLKARKKSQLITRRLKRALRIDFFLGMLLIFFFINDYQEDFKKAPLWGKIVVLTLLILALIISYLQVWHFMKKMKEFDYVNDIAASLRLKIEIMTRYLKRGTLWIYFGCLYGVILAFCLNPDTNLFSDFDWRYSPLLLLLFLFAWVLIKIAKNAYHYIYGRYLKQLRRVLEGLESDEEQEEQQDEIPNEEQ